MKIEELENNETVKEIVDSIISDKAFKDKCKLNFDQIFEDGKVDRDDIPLIINLILTVYQNHTKINISKVHLKPVFMLLITRLLDEFKGDAQLDSNLILLLLEPQIDLLLMSVNLKCDNCPSWCCGKRPEDKAERETNVLQKMKLNKIEKGRMSSVVKPDVVKTDVVKTDVTTTDEVNVSIVPNTELSTRELV